MAFSVLMVCTGNIFRSPAAQYLMVREFGADPGVQVASSGTAPVLGHPVSRSMAELLRRDGVEPGGHSARALTMEEVRDADLVLGMARAHRARALSLWPDAYARCFTVKELAGLARDVRQDELPDRATGYGERFAALVDIVGSRRGTGSEADDIIDPVGQGPEVVEAVYNELVEAVEAIARVVRGRRRRPIATTGQ